MEKIKVGEYFRTRNGIIFKIDKENKNIQMNEFMNMNGNRDIVNHSPNIIDLIEEGDYVNGRLIHKVDIRKNSSYIYYGNGKTFTDYQIETVVTKEQFQSVEYRLEE